MQLLKELNELSYFQPLKEYFKYIEEFGIKPNDDDVFNQIITLYEQIESKVLNDGRSEFSAGRDMAIGAGVNLDDTERRKRQAKFNNPRLGLQDKGQRHPAPGEHVLFAGNGGLGRVVKFKNDSVLVKNKKGYTIEVPRASLIAKKLKNKQKGTTEIGWIEQN